jgi:hypothetical protein
MSIPQHFVVVLQHERDGTVSAWLRALPGVDPAADKEAGTRRGIREALEGYPSAIRARGWQVLTRRAEVAVARVIVQAAR